MDMFPLREENIVPLGIYAGSGNSASPPPLEIGYFSDSSPKNHSVASFHHRGKRVRPLSFLDSSSFRFHPFSRV